MLKRIALTGLVLAAVGVQAQQPLPALMPVPASIEQLPGRLAVNAQFAVKLDGFQNDRLVKAANRFIARLDRRTALFLDQWQVSEAKGSLSIRVQREGRLVLGEDESYALNINSQGMVLEALTDLGALHGLETLLQLLSADSSGYYFPVLRIDDAPRFPWRGLMIDASRHFMPVEVIKRNLDGMAAVKMNVMHWHLSEDQGFRVESHAFPKLHEMGSDGLYYTQLQIRELIAYATDRGIRVVPEFDMPGHATSWLVGYPELASAPGPYSIERRWGVMDPVMDPTMERTYTFLEAFIREMAALFPDAYFHIGGDENNGRQWNASASIQEYMKAHDIPDNHALQAEFNKRILFMLTAQGKKMIGWDEIFHERMPKDIVIHSWRGREAMVKAARQGYQTILSNGYYIDLMQKTAAHYLNDPCPADAPLSTVERQRILGGEATMWSEFVGPETVDSRIWPRTAAIAERFWSPADITDVPDMFRRLSIISMQLEEHGLAHIKNRAMMLRRLCRSHNVHAMFTFLGAVEPVEVYQRGAQKRHYQYSPLTRSVDIALAEAAQANRFNQWVEAVMQHDAEAMAQTEAMRAQLKIWQENHNQIKALAAHAPALKEILPLSASLSATAHVGLEALAGLKAHAGPLDEAWRQSARETLQMAREPHGQLELQIVEAVSQLVEIASN